MGAPLVVPDAGPIFSLATVDMLPLLDSIFEQVWIPMAVWKEITFKKDTAAYPRIDGFFKNRIRTVTGFNELTFALGQGESESILLCQELQADFLLIDDKKARAIAESLGLRCMGTIGLLSVAKERKLIGALRPIFMEMLSSNRYYSVPLLNHVLQQKGENDL